MPRNRHIRLKFVRAASCETGGRLLGSLPTPKHCLYPDLLSVPCLDRDGIVGFT